MEKQLKHLQDSLHTAFIDKSHHSKNNIKPRLVVNNQTDRENLLNYLLEELETCSSFVFSVAFITEGGLAMIKAKLHDLKLKGISGKLLTSTFLYFNKPKIFRELLKIENLEVRITDKEGFHSKGYAFKHDAHYSLIIGSSNLTGHALKTNYELNLIVSSLENGEIIDQFNSQFDRVWNGSRHLTEEWICDYSIIFDQQTPIQPSEMIVESPFQYKVNPIQTALTVHPNKMQKAALDNLDLIRRNGAQKALVISATGTGKTYLSAFDVRKFLPKRMLFIVHREQILQKARSDFKRILGGIDTDFGIYSGNAFDVEAKYLFATIQTISKKDNLIKFDPDEFEYILIDEVHKAGAESYLRILDYFKPKFFLGMTATPERTDGFNIYELFDYNVAYEIRLQEALEEDMLCPFHYFGVSDFEINGELIDETTVFNKIQYEERTKYLLEKVNYYGFSGTKVRGLIFCSRKEEAIEIANILNQNNIRTIALTGMNTQQERLNAVIDLENGLLDYIVTVDIFNEGIDIPSINQVIMLRQTQSSIVFIQQLGRGLRKHESKEFVTIIDFIGNYKNNYMIPIALSGDQTHNKDNIRRKVKDTSFISGLSSVNFEEIAKKQIFKSISDSSLNDLVTLRESYKNLKNKLNRIPMLSDFIKQHSIDPEVIVNKTSYYRFLIQMKEELPTITEYEECVLQFLSLEIMNGKRKHEIILLKMLVNHEKLSETDFLSELANQNCSIEKDVIISVYRMLTLAFFNQISKKKYGDDPLIEWDSNGAILLSSAIRKSLLLNKTFRDLFIDILETAEMKSEKYSQDELLTIYQKYTRKDACRLLNWENDESSTIYGYKPKHGSCPIFVTYHKSEEVDASVNYGDEFISPDVLRWYTRSNRTLASEEVKKILDSKNNGIQIHIFVKKDDDEGTDFYYLGPADLEDGTQTQSKMIDKNNKEIPVVFMNLILKKPIDNKLYSYLIKG